MNNQTSDRNVSTNGDMLSMILAASEVKGVTLMAMASGGTYNDFIIGRKSIESINIPPDNHPHFQLSH